MHIVVSSATQLIGEVQAIGRVDFAHSLSMIEHSESGSRSSSRQAGSQKSEFSLTWL
jgi:hypothetical protein